MRIKLATTYAGPSGCYPIGAVIEVENAEGKALVAGGYGIKVDTPAEKAAPAQTRAQQAAKAKAITEAETAIASAKTAVDTAQQTWELAEGDAKGDALVTLEAAKTSLAAAEQSLADLKAA